MSNTPSVRFCKSRSKNSDSHRKAITDNYTPTNWLDCSMCDRAERRRPDLVGQDLLLLAAQLLARLAPRAKLLLRSGSSRPRPASFSPRHLAMEPRRWRWSAAGRRLWRLSAVGRRWWCSATRPRMLVLLHLPSRRSVPRRSTAGLFRWSTLRRPHSRLPAAPAM
jgi:hypothetical protein